MKQSQSKRIREVYFLGRQNPLVEEDLAAGECDVEKKVGVSEGLTLEQSSQPIRHIRSRRIGNGGYVIMYEEDKTLLRAPVWR